MTPIVPLAPEQVALSLVEKAVDVYMIDGVEIVSRWYQSKEDSDFMLWVSAGGRVVRYQLNVYGQIVDWNRSEGLRSGFIIESEWSEEPDQVKGYRHGSVAKSRTKIAESIRFDPVLNRSTVNLAVSIVQAMDCLSEAWRAAVLESLSDRPQQSNSLFYGQGPNGTQWSLWERMKRWAIGS